MRRPDPTRPWCVRFLDSTGLRRTSSHHRRIRTHTFRFPSDRRPILRARKSKIPGHALHEKGLQRQIGVGTLVNSQQRRALAVPVINHDKPVINSGSTAGVVPSTVYIGFPLFVLAKRRSEQLFTVRWKARGAVGFQGHRNVGT